MAVDVRKTLTETGYVAIGLGVVSAQQAQIKGRELRAWLNETGECVAGRVRQTSARLGDEARDSGSRAQDLADEVEKRIEPVLEQIQGNLDDARKRVEPVIEQVQDNLAALPEQVAQAVEPLTAKVRELLGRAA